MQILFILVIGIGASCIGLCIDQLRKSLASDSSNVQALLAEIRDKLGNNNGDGQDAGEPA